MYVNVDLSRNNALPRRFYARETVDVARDLVGKHLVHIVDGHLLSVRILETEAYRGSDDQASHAHRGRTRRNGVMFETVGTSYVYFIYGMHWLFNIIAHVEGMPGGILIRAGEPVQGTTQMRELRGGKLLQDLANGPARLAQALAIDGECNRLDLTLNPHLYVAAGCLAGKEVLANGPRIRVPGDAVAKSRPWRFWVDGHPMISK